MCEADLTRPIARSADAEHTLFRDRVMGRTEGACTEIARTRYMLTGE